jgi:flavin-binding protein dodecin
VGLSPEEVEAASAAAIERAKQAEAERLRNELDEEMRQRGQ